MRYTSCFLIVAIASVYALPEVAERAAAKGGSSCPAIWTTVVPQLTAIFYNSTINQCTDAARAAIRAAFHDCGTWDQSQGLTGGCDGSLVLANEAGLRPENDGLQDISATYMTLWNSFNKAFTMADLLQVGGAVAVASCPGGPRVTTYVGRVDNSSLAGNPSGFLPDVHANATSLLALFEGKGFTAADLAALVGAHTTSKNVAQTDMPVGAPQDSTPGIWDTQFYSDTINQPAGVSSFASDIALAADPTVGPAFDNFVGVNAQSRWQAAFLKAMTHMSLLGVPGGATPNSGGSGLVDCTTVIPAAKPVKREVMNPHSIWGRSGGSSPHAWHN